MTKVLFVCLGNICRSPAGEGMLRHLAGQNSNLHVESCGLGDWHIGELPDKRMREAAKERGIQLTMRAQQIDPSHFDEFDYILGATQEIVGDLFFYAKTAEHKSKVHLMTAFSGTYHNQDVPDPYYKGIADFELVLDMLEDSCLGLLEEIKKKS